MNMSYNFQKIENFFRDYIFNQIFNGNELSRPRLDPGASF